MRPWVTAVALLALVLAGCTHDKELKESPAQIRQEQMTADSNSAAATTTIPDLPPTTDTTLDPALD
jgi:PBP1b-binding outer membrane lipoprotein LpoB